MLLHILFFNLFLLVISFVTFPSPTNSFNSVAGQSSLVNLQPMLIFLTDRKKQLKKYTTLQHRRGSLGLKGSEALMLDKARNKS